MKQEMSFYTNRGISDPIISFLKFKFQFISGVTYIRDLKDRDHKEGVIDSTHKCISEYIYLYINVFISISFSLITKPLILIRLRYRKIVYRLSYWKGRILL